MSEYQFVAFRAVDRPLSNGDLAFARRQSSRAEITPWSFQNEYHYGDFRGDVNGLLRHGYDVHLHYANFGTRVVSIRLPGCLPFPKAVWSKYIGGEVAFWKQDSKGKGGILTVAPYCEAGELDEIWSLAEYVEYVVELRNRLLNGDARALYLLWLCAVFHDEDDPSATTEPPVPGGLAECSEAFGPLMEFFGLAPMILVAASEGAPAAPSQQDFQNQVSAWVHSQSKRECERLLQRLLVEDAANLKAELVAKIRESAPRATWPCVELGRTLNDLLQRTEVLRAEQEVRERKQREAAERRKAAKQQRERENRMKQMVNDPQKWLREANKLVDERGTQNYRAAAEILADLRDAVGGKKGVRITRKHAAHLAKKHPTLNHLKSSLRKQGLLD